MEYNCDEATNFRGKHKQANEETKTLIEVPRQTAMTIERGNKMTVSVQVELERLEETISLFVSLRVRVYRYRRVDEIPPSDVLRR